MKTCPDCGNKRNDPKATFCVECGAALIEEGELAAGSESALPAAPKQSQSTENGGGKTTTIILGITIGILTVVIIVMVLFLTVWSGEEEKAVGETQDTTQESGTESQSQQEDPAVQERKTEAAKVVRKLLRSLQNENAQGYMSCYEPGYLDEQLAERQASDGALIADMSVEDVLNMVFDLADIEFVDVKLKAESSEEDSAEVTLKSGIVEITISDETMQELDTEELQEYAEIEGNTIKVDLSDDPITVELVKKSGEWFIITMPIQSLQQERGL